MAQTADEIRAEMALTRAQMERSLAELNRRLQVTRRRLPRYQMQIDRRSMIVAGAGIGVLALAGFLALQAHNRRMEEPIARIGRFLLRRRPWPAALFWRW